MQASQPAKRTYKPLKRRAEGHQTLLQKLQIWIHLFGRFDSAARQPNKAGSTVPADRKPLQIGLPTQASSNEDSSVKRVAIQIPLDSISARDRPDQALSSVRNKSSNEKARLPAQREQKTVLPAKQANVFLPSSESLGTPVENKFWGEVTTPFMSRDPNKKNNVYLIEKMRQKDQIVAQQSQQKNTRGLFYKSEAPKFGESRFQRRQKNGSLDKDEDIIWEKREFSREDLLKPARGLQVKTEASTIGNTRRELASFRTADRLAESSREVTADSKGRLANSGRQAKREATDKPSKLAQKKLSPAPISSGGQLAELLGQKKFTEMHNQLMVTVTSPQQDKSNYLNVCKKVRIEIRNEIMRRNMEKTFEKIREQQIKQATPSRRSAKQSPKSLQATHTKHKSVDFRILGRSNVTSEPSVQPRMHLSCNLAASAISMLPEAGDPMREWNETVRKPRQRTFDGRAMSDYYYRIYMKEVHKVDVDQRELLRNLRGDQIIEDRLNPPVEAILTRQKNLRRKYKFVLTRPRRKGPQMNSIDQVLAEMAKKELEEKRKAGMIDDVYQLL